MTGLHVALLGRFVATLDDRPAIKFKTKRSQALLIYLVAENNLPAATHRRELLIELLWPGMPPPSARRSLRQTLYYLRQAIENPDASEGEADSPFLLTDRSTVAINPTYPLQIDVADFQQILDGDEAQWPEAVALYRGDFLEDFYLPDTNTFEEWAGARREDYRRQVLDALDKLTSDRLAREEYAEAEAYAHQQLKIDNLRENAYRQLMQLYARSGRQAEALSLYQKCLQILDQELGASPDQTTTALYEAILENRLPMPSEIGGTPELSVKDLATPPPSPYRGLFAFREEDAPHFFGRGAITDRMVEMIDQNPLLALIGPSASGKSSLLHAGLQARLRREEEWLIASFRPGNRPFHGLAAALLPLLEAEMTETERLVETQKLGQALLDKKLSLTDVVDRLLEKHQHSDRLLLLSDQFEELYSQDVRGAEQRLFIETILELTARQIYIAKPAFCFTFALRADFLDLALGYRPFADALQGSTLILAPMTHEELGQVIEKPAEMQGVSFEDGLVERILTDVGDEPGNLPLLEFGLDALWERQSDRQLTHAAYDDTGRVGEALAHYADSVYAGLEPEDRQKARHIFVQLVRPGRQASDTRRLSRRSELGEENWFLAQYLANARLVVIDRDPTGHETVELVHETLIRRWGRLQTWLNDDRVFRIWQERMRIALQQWLASQHDEGALLRGALLTEAEGWLAERAKQLSQDEITFIKASCAHRDRRERIRRNTTIGLAVGLILAVLLASLAAWQWRSARQARLVAEQERDQTQFALSQLLASQAQLLLDKQIDLSLLLALEAFNKSDSPATRGALLAAVTHNPALRTFLYSEQDQIRSVAISPDGRTLASAGFDNTIILWDLATSQSLGPPLSGHADNIYSLAFSPDGRLLASGSFDDTIILWDLVNHQPAMPPLTGHTDAIWSVDFSPDGDLLASGAADGAIRFWDPRTGLPVGDPLVAHDGTVSAVLFHPAGRLLASAGRDNRALLWDISSVTTAPSANSSIPAPRQLGPPLEGHSGFNRSLAFSSNGQVLAMDGDDDTIQMWDISEALAAAEPVRDSVEQSEIDIRPIGEPISGHEQEITALAFGSADHTLASADTGGHLILWDLSETIDSSGPGNSDEYLAIIGLQSPIWDLAFSADGGTLVTGDGSSRMALFDMTGQHPLAREIDGPGGRLTSAALDPIGHTLAVGGGDGSLSLYDVAKNSDTFGRLLKQAPSGIDGNLRGLAFSHDGTLLGYTGYDGSVNIWNVRSLTPIASSPLRHDGDAVKVAFSPDGTTLASYDHDTTINLWDVNTGRFMHELIPDSWSGTESRTVPQLDTEILFGPEGDWLAATSIDGFILWDLTSIAESSLPDGQPALDKAPGKNLGVELGTGRPSASAISPNGQILATGGLNEGIILLDVRTRKQLAESLSLHRGDIEGLVFSSDGNTLVSIGEYGQIIFWDVKPESATFGQSYGPPIEGPRLANLPEVSFSNDANTLANSKPDGSFTLWNLDIDSWRSLACRRAGRNLTQEEWRHFFGEEPYHQTCPEIAQ